MKYFFFILLLLTQSSWATHPRDQWLTLAQINNDLTLVESAYQRIHPGYGRYIDISVLDKAWQSIKNNAQQNNGMRLADFYLQVSETLAMIRCDHSKAELPKTLADAREIIPVYLPLTWTMIEDQVIVINATKQSGLKLGDVITHIDGMPINQRITQLNKYIPTDGFTDHTKVNAIAASSEHRGGALDHFGAMLWPTEPQANITYTELSGVTRKKAVRRIVYSEWKKLNTNKKRNFIDAVNFKPLNNHTGYLKIDTFVNYRNPIKPDKLYDPIFKKIQANQTTHLILDLRQNGGGSNEPHHRLLAHLMSKKFRPAKDVRVKTLNLDGLKKHLFTWEKSALNPKASRFNHNADGSYSFKPSVLDDTQWIKPDKTAFTGQLIVLTSRNNSSGSTNLMSALKSRPNTTFVGEATGGSLEGPTAGVLFFLKLPESGITARIPVFRYYNDVDNFDVGLGITPDVTVTQSKSDLINGIDTILEAGLKLTH